MSKKHSTGHENSRWFEAALEQILLRGVSGEDTVAGLELYRRKRVMDFVCTPGSVNARIQDGESDRPLRASFKWPELGEEEWKELLELLSREALFLATLLAGELPPELAGLPSKKVALMPRSPKEVPFSAERSSRRSTGPYRVALYQKLVETCGRDPFTLFLLRGLGKEELIHELQLARSRKRPKSSAAPLSGVPAPAKAAYREASDFWSVPPEVSSLSFTIRADDLPASLLKRLDPLPLGELESAAEVALEEAYEHVARRAQVFGLGLSRR
jgi:uncharacterized Zn finger protein